MDPSYVSRVARGERKSAAVVAALQEEMELIRRHLNQPNEQLMNGQTHDGEVRDGRSPNGESGKLPPARAKRAAGLQGTAAAGGDQKAAD